MKSLILKDLYNVGRNAKSMLFILVVFALIFIPFYSIQSYVFVCTILCSMMIVTTFSFDDHSKWMRYAMVMPVSKKDVVAGKFIVLIIFCVIGAVFGLLASFIGGILTKKLAFSSAGVFELLFLTLSALMISIILGGITIPLIFQFGAERGRILLLVSFLIPLGICYGVYQLLSLLGIEMTNQLAFLLLCCSPIFVIAWSYGMYRISYRIFSKQDL